jgi:hypothetical protein
VAFREAYQPLDTSPHDPATLSDGGTAKVHLRTFAGYCDWLGLETKTLCLNGVKTEQIAALI